MCWLSLTIGIVIGVVLKHAWGPSTPEPYKGPLDQANLGDPTQVQQNLRETQVRSLFRL